MTQPNEQLIERATRWAENIKLPYDLRQSIHALLEENKRLTRERDEWGNAFVKSCEDEKSATEKMQKYYGELQQTREELRQVSELQSIAANNCEKLQAELEQVKAERDAYRQEILFGSRTSARAILSQYTNRTDTTTLIKCP